MNKIKLSLGSGSIALSLLFHGLLLFQWYEKSSNFSKAPILYEVSLESDSTQGATPRMSSRTTKKIINHFEPSDAASDLGVASQEEQEIRTGTQTGLTAQVYGEQEVDETAKILTMPAIYYPRGAYQKGIEGDVQFQLIVNKDGIVISAELTKPAGHGFDESALATAKKLKFRPAIKAGKEVAVNIIWNCSFRIDS